MEEKLHVLEAHLNLLQQRDLTQKQQLDDILAELHEVKRLLLALPSPSPTPPSSSQKKPLRKDE